MKFELASKKLLSAVEKHAAVTDPQWSSTLKIASSRTLLAPSMQKFDVILTKSGRTKTFGNTRTHENNWVQFTFSPGEITFSRWRFLDPDDGVRLWWGFIVHNIFWNAILIRGSEAHFKNPCTRGMLRT